MTTDNSIKLNRKQIGQLTQLYNTFKDVEWFELVEDHSSGIGPTVTVRFSLFDPETKTDTTVDITDVSTW
jgi:hypothetical protein